jgi:hypothetical protein
MAEAASARVLALRAQLLTLDAAAAVLGEQARRERGWPQWDAAVVLGLCGKSSESSSFFREVAQDDDDREWWLPVKQDAAELAELVRDDPAQFRACVCAWVECYRAALNLPRAESPSG